jgi:lipoate-protein ligase A
VLHTLLDPALDGPTNMARDEHLLACDDWRPAALRLYAWTPPTLSLGYFQRFDDVARLPEDVRGLPVVRRTTGGGAILHDLEVTYCLVLDDSIPLARQGPVALYELAHRCWRDALAPDGLHAELAPDDFPLPTPRSGPFFCFQKPGRTDLVIAGRKLLGSAQRRIDGRVLQHGSLMLGQRFRSHPGADLGAPPVETVARWNNRFVTALAAALALTPRLAAWTDARLADVAARCEKYASETWTRRR